MARGHARVPSQNAYRGELGRTQTVTVHVTAANGDLVATTVYTAVDAVSDPELAERLLSDDPARALNPIASPIIYHDPAAELLVLVLGEPQRHREIDERIKLLGRLGADHAAIPAYAKEFVVVLDSAALRAHLEDCALAAMHEARRQDLDRKRGELETREDELVRARAQIEHARAQLEQDRAAHEVAAARAESELERLRAEQRARVIKSVQGPVAANDATTIGPTPTHELEHATTKITLPEVGDLVEASLTQLEHGSRAAGSPAPTAAGDRTNGRAPQAADGGTTDTAMVPPGSDLLTTETQDLGVPTFDTWLDRAAAGAASALEVREGIVRLAVLVDEPRARDFVGALDVRLLLHRVNTSPVITLVIGPPAALRVPSPAQLVTVTLDIGAELDRQVIAALAKRFAIEVTVISGGVQLRSLRLTAPLADNAAYILRAADDHLRGIAADHVDPSFQRAKVLVDAPDYDLLGTQHPEHVEFRDDRLSQLATAQQLRRALAIARRFARPSREDYLICTRGFPLQRWRELRRHVLESAVAWGIWMGPELAQVAVSEGLARSRRDLIAKLDTGFEELRRHPTAFDIDADAADDNSKAIAEEARALGVELRKKPNGAIKSEEMSMVSGSIDGTPINGLPRLTTTEQLLAMLEDKAHRVAAASELCDRGPGLAAPVAAVTAPAVVAAVKKMSRAEAVRILGRCVKFGAVAAPPLIEGLRSSKAFLRHGCALALALLRTDEGTYAVIDALITEPTEVWREIARALGQVGPAALMPLASHTGRLGDRMTPQIQERVAWAMAHVGVRGGRSALDQMAAGQSVLAPIARQALDLLEIAARDEVRVRPGAQAIRDVTVNRAFSRRFFEALDGAPDDARAALHDLDVSGPMEMLDDGDLIVEDEEEAELDESDLIQS